MKLVCKTSVSAFYPGEQKFQNAAAFACVGIWGRSDNRLCEIHGVQEN